MKMSIHIFNLLNVYTFLKDQATWSNETKRHVSIVSYQVEGHYNHTFPFGELEVKKDRVFTINPSDTYFVKQISPGHSICLVFTSDTPIATELIDCSNDPRFYHLFKKILQYKNHPQKGKTAILADKFLNLINVHDPEFDPTWTRLQIIEFILKLTKESK